MTIPATVYVITDEDWSPSFYLEDSGERLLRLSMRETFFEYAVAVWGADDLGMEVKCVSEVMAYNMYNHICTLPIVTREVLKQLGFKYT